MRRCPEVWYDIQARVWSYNNHPRELRAGWCYVENVSTYPLSEKSISGICYRRVTSSWLNILLTLIWLYSPVSLNLVMNLTSIRKPSSLGGAIEIGEDGFLSSSL